LRSHCFVSACLAITLLVQICHAQVAADTKSAEIPANLDNKRVAVLRYRIAAQQELALPKLNKESLIVFLQGQSVKRTSDKGTSESFEATPRGVLWDRGGVAYSLWNLSDSPVELLVIELKDSYAIAQMRVPYSERDPLNLDPTHFRELFQNEHVRVLQMHLGPREGTTESQFADRLEIALSNMRATDTDAGGKTGELLRDAGSVSWEKAKMHSMVNVDERPLDSVIVELRHPFCYEIPDNLNEMPRASPAMKAYISKLSETVNRKWIKNMPRAVREEESKGLVLLQFKIESQGTVPEDDIRFQTVFADDARVGNALRAVRDSGPFPAFPPDFQEPFVRLRFFFLYNLPQHPSGCK
jgi:hypothetical protein